ncbi:dol-P-Glc:Glc(2)Man(9)GlcNAc(2)-PP-Dol alpha-1,2-glucosyltransferase [Poeciliopsis prolifica]|uniref:dol-P-Glc:Glc(2)Man(9)GlcNAc(2)-PP-Dol alpha-1,2-glucosyltransferase n=1 Tax=Poeciliopsis prolifica TaxID=188132 RepID=UPI00241423DC|nr:dol-P-Glc:Glc(2)Man(9)GlcNAc(2)-PP-Dol alpha-1,2-glucosyltransferase [Poeciliopsis prolifica]
MEKLEVYVFSALCSVNFLVSCLLFYKVARVQRDPYMDEIFHVPQAQRYCRGKFNEWDPMITTPPGLYLVSVGIIKPMAWAAKMTGGMMCSTAMLRFTNVLFNSGNFYLLYLLISKLHQRDTARLMFRRILCAAAMSTFPVLYFFTFLYYTDAGSTFFILFAYLMTLYGCHKVSALLGICAVLFRQTNIVWVGFCAGTLVAAKMDDVWRTEYIKKRDERPPAVRVPLTSEGVKKVIMFFMDFFTTPENVKAVLQVTWPYVMVAVGFVVFVLLNEGIVMGDRMSHQVTFNFPQIFYFFSFTYLFSLPVSVCSHRTLRFSHALRRHPLFFFVITIVSLLLVWKFTYVHRYLLADNRHYTFYIWKRIYQKHPHVRLLLVPAYIFTGWNFLETLKSRSFFMTLAYMMCLALTTIPQELLEFRYFIIPYLIYRLHMPLPPLSRLTGEFLLYTVVNAVTIYLFVAKSFSWPLSLATQRFMW